MSLVFQNIDPPSIPLSAWRVCPSPQQRRGYTLAGRRGGWGVNILEDKNQCCLLTESCAAYLKRGYIKLEEPEVSKV
jgi:hypothetical protein